MMLPISLFAKLLRIAADGLEELGPHREILVTANQASLLLACFVDSPEGIWARQELESNFHWESVDV